MVHEQGEGSRRYRGREEHDDVPAAKKKRPPRLPEAVGRKLYKTGETRGATPAQIYQNRVGRRSTALIPFSHWAVCKTAQGVPYENGYIVLIDAGQYFADPTVLAAAGLTLGTDALVFYTRRSDWVLSSPSDLGWTRATSRLAPLGGSYVARISATKAGDGGASIREGFTSTASRGAGIRVHEYASARSTELARLQLEALIWMCEDADEVLQTGGMTVSATDDRKAWRRTREEELGVDLTDLAQLRECRAINAAGHTVCPLCLASMSVAAFSDRIEQASGQEKFDTTITEGSLFHIAELRVGELGHKPYNVAWGHHHCNVVAKDAGVPETMRWMREVVARNDVA